MLDLSGPIFGVAVFLAWPMWRALSQAWENNAPHPVAIGEQP